MKFRKSFKILAIFFAVLFVIFLILDKFYPLNLKALSPNPSPILYDISGEVVRIKLNSEGIFMIKADKIPEILKKSVLYYEDRYFYYHFGINPASIARAAWHNLTHKNRIGASTITMQVARMMDKNERTYANKFKEIFRAFQLEWHFSKDEILNMYFNLAPYGGNLQGVATAARFYFDKDLSRLSYAQMALLSTIPKNPNKNRLDKKSNITALKNSVIKKLYNAKIIDKSAYNRALNEPFKNKRLQATYNAPEFSEIAYKNGISHSALNLEIQNNLLNLLKRTMNELKDKNANNAAGVVIDNKTMQVVAFIGSHDERAKDGKNSALNMKRNVGSTLKLFIYSLALDNGLITPKMKLIDTEIYIDSYNPQNFNGAFFGMVSATDALGLSLNIPPINLNQKLGENSLYELLDKANIVNEKKEFYGASIALGSAEMSLLNLAHLYTIYANGGVLKPLNIAGAMLNSQKDDIKLISEQSAFLTAKMLSSASRAYLKNAWEYAKDTPKIAFKTGASYGYRDLYAIGVNANYTIAVWIGNFNSRTTDKLTGLNDASKVIFDMFKILNLKQKLSFIDEPNGIIKRQTCLDPFKFKECKDMQIDEHIMGVEIKDICESVRGEELDFMIKNSIIKQDELENSHCIDRLKSTKPLIASPYNGEIVLSDLNQTKIMIKCYAYIGKNVLIKVNDEPFFKAQSGSENIVTLSYSKHKIGCLDEFSNFSEALIEIRK